MGEVGFVRGIYIDVAVVVALVLGVVRGVSVLLRGLLRLPLEVLRVRAFSVEEGL